VSAPAAAPARPRIAVLDALVADQIAAGEVIERPASVVKELVENALDAGALEVHVTLEEGGCKRIVVRDDGHGMSPEDAERACLRHATSKLSRIEDLGTLTSLGFRGEALASIAAAAEVTIVTRERHASSGVRLTLRQGKVVESAPAGAPVGTTVEVRDLFATLPARRKFLKSAPTELAHASDLLQRLALARPEVGLACLHGSREVLRYPAVARGEERVRQVLGAERAKVMVPVERREVDLHVHGWVSRAGHSYPQARAVLTYVGGRLVRDRVLMRAVLDAYRALLPSGRYPATVLFLDLPPAAVDVNVHPAKVEVRFAQADAVYGVVVRALRAALAEAAAAPGATPPGADAGEPEPQRAHGPASGGTSGGPERVQEALTRYAIRRAAEPVEPLFRAAQSAHAPSARAPASPATAHDGRLAPEPASGAEATRPTFGELRVIGQAFGGWLVCESRTSLVLVDQHAAHERVRFERLRAAPPGDASASQRLLVPRVVELDATARERLLARAADVAAAGFELEAFGDRAVLLRALPAALDVATDAERLLADLAADFGHVGASEQMASARDALLARIACHGAVRAGDPLERQEMVRLLADLDTIPFAATCPHGRPLLVEIERGELLRRVRRT
jgi:DNA mismatch repair protein MutL